MISLNQPNLASAPFPELLMGVLILFWLGPVIWGFLCSLQRRRFLGLFLLFVPYVTTLILWPNLLNLNTLFDYPLVTYIIPSLIGYILGLVLVKREKQPLSRARMTICLGMIIFYAGYSLMLADHLGHGVLDLFYWALVVLIIGVVVGVCGVTLKRKQSEQLRYKILPRLIPSRRGLRRKTFQNWLLSAQPLLPSPLS